MDWLWLTSGIVVLTATVVDIFIAAMLPSGASGPVTGRINRLLWTGMLRLGSHRVLQFGGVGLMTLTFLFWVAGLWMGWSLIFASASTGIVATGDAPDLGFWSRLYFIGFTFSGLGIGDYRPDGPVWQLLTIFAVITGVTFVSLALSYLFAVVSSTVDRQRVASYIAALGDTPYDIVRRFAPSASQRDALAAHIDNLLPDIIQLGEDFLAYPIVAYFHNPDPSRSVNLQLAKLDEAVSLMRYGVDDLADLPPRLELLHRSVDRVLMMVKRRAFASRQTPPEPDLSPLTDEVSLVDQQQFEGALADCDARRRRMRRFVEDEGWDWSQIWQERSHDAGDKKS